MEATAERLIDVRRRDHQQGSFTEVLIKWQDLPLWEATWEDFDSINLLFPGFHLEDKVANWTPGIVTTPAQDMSNVITYARKRIKEHKGLSSKMSGAEE